MLTHGREPALKRFRLVPVLSFPILISDRADKHRHLLPKQMSIQDKSNRIRQLDPAKEQDWSNALDPKVSELAREDFLKQGRSSHQGTDSRL